MIIAALLPVDMICQPQSVSRCSMPMEAGPILTAVIFGLSPQISTSLVLARPSPRRYCTTTDHLQPLTISQKCYISGVLEALKQFGYNFAQLNGANVHSLFNVMTMAPDIHDFFGRLELWFEKAVSESCKSVFFCLIY